MGMNKETIKQAVTRAYKILDEYKSVPTIILMDRIAEELINSLPDGIEEDEKRCRKCKHFNVGDYDIPVWCDLHDKAFEDMFYCMEWINAEEEHPSPAEAMPDNICPECGGETQVIKVGV